MDVIPLFPTPVAVFQLDRELTKKEIKFIENQEQRPNAYNTTSANNYILEHKKMAKLRPFIQNCIDEYVKKILCPATDFRLRITQSWTNYTEPNAAHHRHVHPNSLVSGVFYPQADISKDKIYFWRQTGYKQLDYQKKEFHEFNSESWWLNVGKNMFILFPSSLEHTVEPVCDGQLRISLAVNTFPVGYLGDDYTLTGLKLKE